MATVQGAGGDTSISFDYVWTPLTEVNTDGNDVQLVRNTQSLTLQVSGTFGTGGSVTLVGSNDGANYIALKDIFNNAITITAGGIVQLGVNVPKFIHPRVTAGTGVSVTVNLHGALIN